MFPTKTSRAGARQEGFTLAALIVVLTIISIVVAYTVPTQWSMVMKRERDRQTIFQMKQFARAIMQWQLKHNNTAPVSLEQLAEARNPRLLRGNGIPPMPLTGNEKDWIMVPPTAIMPANAPPIGQQNTGLKDSQGRPATTPVPVQMTPTGVPASRLNKEASPKDYTGPFIAVRPNYSGKSFVALNGAEDYSDWVYTVDDLRNELNARRAALTPR